MVKKIRLSAIVSRLVVPATSAEKAHFLQHEQYSMLKSLKGKSNGKL